MRVLLVLAALAVSVAASATQPGHTTYIKWNADAIAMQVPAGRNCGYGNSPAPPLVQSTIDTTAGNFVEGTGSMKVTMDGTQENVGCWIDQLNTGVGWYSGEWVCYHLAMKFDPAFDWNHNENKLKMNRLLDNQGPYTSFTSFVRDRGFDIGNNANEVAIVNYDMRPGGPNNVTSWHDYTIGIKLQTGVGTPDGLLKVWVDGNFVGVSAGAELCSPGYTCQGNAIEAWGAWGMPPYPQSPIGTIWFDNFEATSGPNECLPRNVTTLPAPVLLTN
jgi:hypothetical protein